VNLIVDRRGRSGGRGWWGAMAKCKLHIRWLMLAPGALSHLHLEKDEDEIDEEVNCIPTREHLH
jgi:hypothetical protein